MAGKAELALMRTSPTGISQGGFTLLELVLVVSLVGLLIGVSLPNWQGRRQEVSLRLASSQLAQFLRYGLSLAATQKQEFELLWDGVEFSLVAQEGDEQAEKYRLPAAISYEGPQQLSLPIEGTFAEEVSLELNYAGEHYTVTVDSQGLVRSFPGGKGDV